MTRLTPVLAVGFALFIPAYYIIQTPNVGAGAQAPNPFEIENGTNSTIFILNDQPQIEVSSTGEVRCEDGSITEVEMYERAGALGSMSGVFIALWRKYCLIKPAPLSTFEGSHP